VWHRLFKPYTTFLTLEGGQLCQRENGLPDLIVEPSLAWVALVCDNLQSMQNLEHNLFLPLKAGSCARVRMASQTLSSFHPTDLKGQL